MKTRQNATLCFVVFSVGCLGLLAVGLRSVLLAMLFPVGVCLAIVQNLLFLTNQVWAIDNSVPWALDYKILRECRVSFLSVGLAIYA